jgi:dephospho-CoA kinase
MKNRLVIGLTGNIATGKSTIMQLAAAHGADIIDADRVAHGILTLPAVKDAIAAAFGSGVFADDGTVNRRALGRIVFSDAAALEKLEHITHPAVRAQIMHHIDTSSATILMVEAIKLLEGPLHTVCDQIWVTFCSPYVQIERLKLYRGLTQDEAEARVAAQGSQEEKIARADVVFDTNGPLSATEAQFERAWRMLIAENDWLR